MKHGMLAEPGLRVRRATRADAAAIWAVHRSSISELCGKAYAPEVIGRWIARLEPCAYTGFLTNEWTVVAEGPHGIVGFAIVSLRTGELHALYVRPAEVRHGVGRMLVRATEAEMLAQGQTIVMLNATLNSVEFYRRLGFAALGNDANVLPGGVAVPCVRMGKMLTLAGEA